MIKAAVIGNPISHSLSPKLHGFLLEKYNIKASYEAIEIKPENLEKDINILLSDPNFKGFNITIPYKEKAYEILKKQNCIFHKDTFFTNSINTVYKENGNLYAASSDGFGFIKNLEFFTNSEFLNKKNKSAIIFGAGGAAKSIIPALIQENFDQIFIINRNQEKIKQLAFQYPQVEISQKTNENVDLIINTTSLGMKNQEELILDFKNIDQKTYIYDIVYNPLITRLLSDANKNGNKIITGIGMLIFQAFLGFEKWFGIKPELTQEEFEELSKILII
jgi:shikimate dehydrogenase